MRAPHFFTLALALGTALAAVGSAAQATEPSIKVLAAPEDATQKTVLVGRNVAGAMIIQLELEPAKAMWMQMGNPSTWTEHEVGAGELFHVEVKPIDPKSKTRISYADVRFAAVNSDNGQRVQGILHPMWGGSGLHYAMNSGLAGNGTYVATVTVSAPTFARDLKDKNRWMQPATATFHFKLAGGKLTEVSEPMAEAALEN